jgi:inner membrane protein
MRAFSHIAIALAGTAALTLGPTHPMDLLRGPITATGTLVTLETIGLAVPLVILGALLPDLDAPGSMVARSLGPITRGIAWLTRHVFQRRGLLHTPLPALALWLTGHPVGQWIALGYAWHLVADALTDSGIPVLPWCGWRLRAPLTVRTGSVGETVVALAIVGLCVVWIVR